MACDRYACEKTRCFLFGPPCPPQARGAFFFPWSSLFRCKIARSALTRNRCLSAVAAPRRRLGPQSFEFLVAVAEFKTFNHAVCGGIGDEVSLDFARFLDIVNTYIKYDSHLEINIGSDLKRDIMDYTKLEAYLLLGPVSCTKISSGSGDGVASNHHLCSVSTRGVVSRTPSKLCAETLLHANTPITDQHRRCAINI